MEYRTLGRTGLKVSAIAMGTFSFGGVGAFSRVANQGVAEARRLVDCCIDGGVNLFDTANMYSLGRSEEILGEALGTKRKNVLISSKARMRIGDGPNDEGVSRYHLIRECEASLKRLKTDHIDIYFMHEWDGVTPVEEMLGALDTLRQQGKIAHLGLTNFNTTYTREILDAGIPLVSTQVQYSLLDGRPDKALVALCRERGLQLLCYGTLAGGLLSDAWLGQPEPQEPLANRSHTKYKLIIEDFGGWALFQELLRALDVIARRLGVGLGDVATFVRENRDILGKNIEHINRVAKVLVKQRAALDETLRDAPVALNNLALTYNPQAGTLDTNANIGELVNQITSDPATLVCGFLSQADKSGQLCNVASQVLKRSAPFGTGTSYGEPFDLSLGGLVATDEGSDR